MNGKTTSIAASDIYWVASLYRYITHTYDVYRKQCTIPDIQNIGLLYAFWSQQWIETNNEKWIMNSDLVQISKPLSRNYEFIAKGLIGPACIEPSFK